MKIRSRRLLSVDLDHLRFLHEEALDQLELMRTVLEAAERSAGTMRDTLENIVSDHWQGYLEIIHLICMHDTAMDAVLKKHGMNIREEELEENERQSEPARTLPFLLITALIRRHKRLWRVYGLQGNPMTEYLKDSITMEREHIAELIAMVQDNI